jgi:hypothetical protein
LADKDGVVVYDVTIFTVSSCVNGGTLGEDWHDICGYREKVWF